MSGSAFGFLDGHRKLLNGDLDRALADCFDDLFLSLAVLPRRPEAKLHLWAKTINKMLRVLVLQCRLNANMRNVQGGAGGLQQTFVDPNVTIALPARVW